MTLLASDIVHARNSLPGIGSRHGNCLGAPTDWEADVLPLNDTREMLGFGKCYRLTV